jgi:TonB-dependent receptor
VKVVGCENSFSESIGLKRLGSLASDLTTPCRPLFALCFYFAVLALPARAMEAARLFDVPAGDAAETLPLAARQGGLEIIFFAETVRGVQTPAIRGEWPPRTALERLIAGTGLVFVDDPQVHTITVRRQSPPAGDTAPRPSSPSPPMTKKNLVTTISAWLAFALGPAALASDVATGTIEGRVWSAVNGSHLNNALVTLTDSGRQELTNSFGEFRFENVNAGPVSLRVAVAGFPPQSQTVNVERGGVAKVNFSLNFAGPQESGAEGPIVKLDSFIVESKREITGSAIALNERRTASNLVHVIAADEFGDSPEGNAAELLKLMSGIGVAYIGSDPRTVSVRGLPSHGTPVLFDGAPMATSTGGRETEFSQVSLNNAARIDVIKSPTPDTRADSIGGTINIVSRNAFERSRPVFNYRANLSANSTRWGGGDYLSLGRTPGAQSDTHKVLPNFDVNYLKPLSKNLGFTLSAVSSSQFTPDTVHSSTWSPTHTGTSMATFDRPFLRSLGLQYGIRHMYRRSIGGTVDWRATPRDVFNLAVQYNWQRTPVAQDLQTFNVIGSRAELRGYGPTFVRSGLGAGSITHALSMYDRIANSYNLQLKHRRTGAVWTLEEAASFSESWSGDFVWRAGIIKTVNLSASNVTIGLDGIQDSIPRSIATQTATSAPFDWMNLGNYGVRSATVVPPGLTRNATASARVSAARDFAGLIPLRTKLGADWRRLSRDTETQTLTYTFVGPDGVANTADDAASRYDLVADSWSRVSIPFGLGQPQKPSPEKAHALLRSHPEYWTLNEVTAISSRANDSNKVNEHVLSGFLRFDASFLRNRLKLVGGVRYEATFTEGWGVLNDLSKTYQKDATGEIVRAANGTPVRVSSDPAALARLQYTRRGSYAKSDYGDFYPSANVTYLLSERLMARASFARTITRPQLSDLIPSMTATDPTATTSVPTITVTNLGLRPWYSNSFDFGLEYYFEKPGVLSISAFRKDITDFFASIRSPVTPAQLAEWGFGDSFSHYDVLTQQNLGSARVTGVEYEYRHTLPWVPERWGNLLVHFNATTLDVDGVAAAELSGFMPLTMNYGFTYSTARLTARANWNHLGRMPQGLRAIGANMEPETRNHRAPRTTLDVNFELRLIRRLALFANVRNLTDVPWRYDAYGPNTPDYARGTRWAQYGANILVGVKGSF